MDDLYTIIGDNLHDRILRDQKTFAIGYHLKKACEENNMMLVSIENTEITKTIIINKSEGD